MGFGRWSACGLTDSVEKTKRLGLDDTTRERSMSKSSSVSYMG
jgi:hypothetical protein